MGEASAEGQARTQMKIPKIVTLAANCSVLCIAETHGAPVDYGSLWRRFRATHHLVISLGRSAAAGGILCLVDRRFLRTCAYLRCQIHEPGRSLTMQFGTLQGLIDISVLHIVPQWPRPARIRQIRSLADAVQPPHLAAGLLVGDFNFSAELDETYHVHNCTFNPRKSDLAAAFTNSFGGWYELAQGDYTCRSGAISSRLDRCYTNVPLADILDAHPFARTVWPLKMPYEFSDHVPIRIVFPDRSDAQRRVTFPSWVAEHELFPTFCENILARRLPLDQLCLDRALRYARAILTEASRMVLRHVQLGNFSSPSQKMHLLIQAYRRSGRGDLRLVQQLRPLWPEVDDCFCNDSLDRSLLHQLLSNLTIELADVRISELDGLSNEKATRTRTALQRWRSLWSRQTRTISKLVMRRADGSQCSSDAEGAEVLRQHWEPLLGLKHLDRERALGYLDGKIRPFPAETGWQLPEDEFWLRALRCKRTAPGPTGITYAMWIAAPPCVRCILYRLYVATFDDEQRAQLMAIENFNSSYFAFLAKGDEPDDHQYGVVSRLPGKTRTLSLRECDNKVVTSGIAAPFRDFLPLVLEDSQYGGRRRTSTLHAFLAIEGASLGMVATSAQAGLALIDFTSAFPMLCLAFLDVVLEIMRVPICIREVILWLYRDNWHSIVINNKVYPCFCKVDGLAQGCPLAAYLFTVAINPLLWHLRALFPDVRGCSRIHASGYYDDVAVALLELLPCLDRLFAALSEFSWFAGPTVNLDKTVIVPLWSFRRKTVREAILRCLGFHLDVQSCGKLLGLHIGPGSADCVWKNPLRKFQAACRHLSGFGPGLVASIAHYNVRIAPILSYIVQCFPVTKEALHVETWGLNTLHKGPFRSLPTALLFNLRSFGFPIQRTSLKVMAKASALRVGLRLAPDLLLIHERLARILSSDEVLLANLPPLSGSFFFRTLAISILLTISSRSLS